MVKVRKGGSEEIPLVQGKEHWLHFAGAAMKRYPTPKVRETQVRHEKNHVAPPSSQDEALSRYSASGEVPR